MARAPKSQWEFGNGELFSPAETRAVLSVGELTTRVKRLVEKEFPSIFVRGEVSNLRQQASGHAYFVLKDAAAQLPCVLFRGQGGPDRAALRDGAQLILGGEITVYEPRGAYQLRVTHVEAEGLGALQAAYERLKQKLAAEGLFAPERKRPIPAYPKRIGLVTSPSAAALADVLHVLTRRFAGLEIVFAPTRVQGAGAAAEIVTALERLNRWSATHEPLDLILVTRGGGSLEDLWCFNEEIVARAVAASALPVVSAVGHEIDFTIIDFVADLRAATPSAAAELLTAHHVASREFIARATTRLWQQLRRRQDQAQDDLADWVARLARAHPRRRLESQSQRLDELQQQLVRAVRRNHRHRHTSVDALQRALGSRNPRTLMAERRRTLLELVRRMPGAARRRWEQRRTDWRAAETRLRLLNPANVLERGYSLTTDANTGALIRNAAEVKAGQRLRTRLARGEVGSVATQITD